MKTQIKILGSIDILLGAYFTWTLVPLYESVAEFIQKEFIWTIILVGLFIGGIGHWTKLKTGWIANQVTWIHIFLSTLTGIVIGLKSDDITINDEFYFNNFILVALVVVIGGGLFWTSRQQWLNEFKISSKLRLITISIGALVSLVFLLKSYV